MPQLKLGRNVWEEAVRRMYVLMEQGHRVSVSMSGGKDSGVCLEVCLEARRRLIAERKWDPAVKLDVVMRDEEIMYPGTFEYCERVWHRPEVDFKWLYAGQPITNAWHRAVPYWWVFDDRLQPEEWVRKPPPFAIKHPYNNIESINTPWRFPPQPGKKLVSVIGLRVSESPNRRRGLWSSRGYIAGGHCMISGLDYLIARPIYDWTDDDVWKAHKEFGWDYNHAYDVFQRFGVPKTKMRIAPPTLIVAGGKTLEIASRAWPQWFDRVANRLPGLRLASRFGARVMEPYRRAGETWRDTFFRVCVDEAPKWISERAMFVHDFVMEAHSRHSSEELPEVGDCKACPNHVGSWRSLASHMFGGDPFCLKVKGILPFVEPETFRPELVGTKQGRWDGRPAFA